MRGLPASLGIMGRGYQSGPGGATNTVTPGPNHRKGVAVEQCNPEPEEWRFIPGLEGWYQASTLGRIRSVDHESRNRFGPYIRRGRVLELACPPSGGGYRTVHIGGRVRRVHQLVLSTFVGPQPKGLVVRHLNGDKSDNRLVNLCYGTYLENNEDVIRHGNHNNAHKTHCKNGHEFTLENTISKCKPGKKPYRECRVCRREYGRLWRLGLVGGA